MYRFNKIKAVLLFFILIIVVFGCQNTTNSSAQEEASVSRVEKLSLTLDEGMTCGGCERTVQGALTAIEGVDFAFASYMDKQVKIFADAVIVNIFDMQRVINAKGYTTGNLVE